MRCGPRGLWVASSKASWLRTRNLEAAGKDPKNFGAGLPLMRGPCGSGWVKWRHWSLPSLGAVAATHPGQ